jgi:acetyl esterase/lipase
LRESLVHRAQGLDLGRALKASGVPTTTHVYPRQMHGFIAMVRVASKRVASHTPRQVTCNQHALAAIDAVGEFLSHPPQHA